MPRKTDPPFEFHCAFCQHLVRVDPATGDRRYRYCSPDCHALYWYHKRHELDWEDPIT